MSNVIRQFTGTEGYTRTTLSRNLVLTDGWLYLAEKAGAYWLADVVSSWQPRCLKDPGLRDFQLWQIKVNDNNSCVVSVLRDTDDPVFRQKIPFTDFPLKSFEWYVIPDFGLKASVMMLKSEY
jgi:hypothetical protein